MATKLDAKTKEQADFVLDCIHSLRTPPYQGIHTVFSGFNDLCRVKYPTIEPKTLTTELETAGIIRIVPAKRGVMLYDASEPQAKAVKKPSRNVDALLAKLPARWKK